MNLLNSLDGEGLDQALDSRSQYQSCREIPLSADFGGFEAFEIAESGQHMVEIGGGKVGIRGIGGIHDVSGELEAEPDSGKSVPH